MGIFNNNYDAGFLNVPGFGQSVTNPLAPVFYDSLGIVNDLSVYKSIYAAENLNVAKSATIGSSELSDAGFSIQAPTTFTEDVNIAKLTSTERLVVAGKEYVATTISTNSGSFTVLAAV